jgi:hypothetical protein
VTPLRKGSLKPANLKIPTHSQSIRRVAASPLEKRRFAVGKQSARIEEVEDPLIREIRHLDKLVDELANGKTMEKILRTS